MLRRIKNLIKFFRDLFSKIISTILYPIGLLIFLILNFKKRYLIFNHRNYGFGHQLIELPYADFILNKKKIHGVYFIQTRPANKYLNKIFSDKIFFIPYIFYFFFRKNVDLFLKSRKFDLLDVGSAPNEIDIHSGTIAENHFLKISKMAHKKTQDIYKTILSSDFDKYKTKYIEKINIEKKNFYKKVKNKTGINLDNEWYVCLHAREDYQWMLERSNSICNYSLVAKYINDMGGKVIRLGKNLKNYDEENFITICNKGINSDLDNILFLAFQKFMISSSSGPSLMNCIFKIPQLVTNVTWDGMPLFENEIYLFKVILNKEKNFVKYSDYNNFYKKKNFCKQFQNYEIVENNANDILKAFKNLYHGNFELEDNHKNLQKKWKSSFDIEHPIQVTKSNIDKNFLENYESRLFN